MRCYINLVIIIIILKPSVSQSKVLLSCLFFFVENTNIICSMQLPPSKPSTDPDKSLLADLFVSVVGSDNHRLEVCPDFLIFYFDGSLSFVSGGLIIIVIYWSSRSISYTLDVGKWSILRHLVVPISQRTDIPPRSWDTALEELIRTACWGSGIEQRAGEWNRTACW